MLLGCCLIHIRGGSRTVATSKMELFVIIVNGFQPLTIITKRSILDVAAVLDPPLYIIIIILRQILYLVHLFPYIGLGLFMPYLCDLVLIFSLIFIVINHITSLKQTHLFFVHLLEYLLLPLDDNVDEASK